MMNNNETNIKFCPSCGANVEGMNFCKVCGYHVGNVPYSPPVETPKKISTKKPKFCDCCGKKIKFSYATMIADGYICSSCGAFVTNPPTTAVRQVQAVVINNKSRFKMFNTTLKIKDFGSNYIFVDTEQQYCFVSYYENVHSPLASTPVVFKFSEIEGFGFEVEGEKTIIKTKNGITRGVVGGALFGEAGAIVGAGTAQQEIQKTGGTRVLYIDLNISGLKTTVSLYNPPHQAKNFLINAMDQAE